VTIGEVHRRYLALMGLRWFPTGLLIPVLALLPLDRGLSVAQLGLVTAVQGWVVFAMELPTGGFADSLGRRPVLVTAAGLSLVSLFLLFMAHSMAMFAAAYAVQGLFRALDSGPLEAWYVDAVRKDNPSAEIARGLSGGSAILGLAVGMGAIVAGGLVALDPFPGVEALALPVLAAGLVQVVGLVSVIAWVVEDRPDGPRRYLNQAVRGVLPVIRTSVALLRRSRVLVALVSVELFWGFGMVTFETLFPVRLAEVGDGTQDAAAVMGPTTAAAWGVSALGAVLAPVLARRMGAPMAAGALRIVQGVTVSGMGLFAGPIGLIGALLATYVVHGASNPLHMTLLHDQVGSAHRATVIGLNSMVAQPAGAVGVMVLTALAGGTSLSTAFLAGGVVLAMGAPFYLPAHRATRGGRAA